MKILFRFLLKNKRRWWGRFILSSISSVIMPINIVCHKLMVNYFGKACAHISYSTALPFEKIGGTWKEIDAMPKHCNVCNSIFYKNDKDKPCETQL